jgi:hypothetical protein
MSDYSLIQCLVEHRDAERARWISFFVWKSVQSLNECRARVPGASLGVNGFLDVFACQTTHGDKREVALSVSTLNEEGRQVVSDFVPTGLAPVHAGVVHLVYDNHQLLNTEGLCELNVLTGLSLLLETGFVLTLAS